MGGCPWEDVLREDVLREDVLWEVTTGKVISFERNTFSHTRVSYRSLPIPNEAVV